MPNACYQPIVNSIGCHADWHLAFPSHFPHQFTPDHQPDFELIARLASLTLCETVDALEKWKRFDYVYLAFFTFCFFDFFANNFDFTLQVKDCF